MKSCNWNNFYQPQIFEDISLYTIIKFWYINSPFTPQVALIQPNQVLKQMFLIQQIPMISQMCPPNVTSAAYYFQDFLAE